MSRSRDLGAAAGSLAAPSSSNNGYAHVVDTTQASGWNFSGNQVAGKNYIHNGGFDVWQRNTTFTVTGLGYAAYSADRWHCYAGAAGTITQDSTLYAPGARYGLRFTSTVATSAMNWYQMIETSNAIALAGQTVCMSLYAAGTAGTTGHYMNLQYSVNIDAGLFDAGWTNCPTSTTILYSTITGTMQRHIATFVIPSNAKSLRAQWTTGILNSTQYQTISGFQLELGNVATPFTRAGGNIATETQICQRYYETSYPAGLPIGSNLSSPATYDFGAVSLCASVPVTGVAGSQRARSESRPYMVEKRIVPAIQYWDWVGNLSKYSSGNNDRSRSGDNLSVDTYGGPIATNKSIQFQTTTSSSTHIVAGIMWAVSADL